MFRAVLLRIVLPWTALAMALLGVLVLVRQSEALPRPLPASAPATAFSGERARAHVDELSESIGIRLTGTEGNRAAAEYLLAQMRSIPGLAVEVQEVEGVRRSRDRATVFAVRNLVARLEGNEPGAILVSSHYDTKTDGPGAGDAASPAAVVLETMRALASSPRPRRSVVFLLNDGEELGLLGASGFLQHRWAEDVRLFVNLESAGPGGRPILFQTGPGNAWLARAWSASVPHPYGTVIGQDVFQSGVIPSDTDFRIFRDDGRLTGIDYALVRNGWAYHTHLDRLSGVSAGSLQEMGANVLALVRSLANRGALPRSSTESAVYYDLAGLAMIAYPESVARLLAIALIAIAAGAWIAATVRRRTKIGATLGGALVAILAFVLPLAAAAGIGLAGPALGRAHRWYAVLGPAIGAWVAGALAGLFLAASLGALLLRRSDLRRRQGAIAAGAALFWAVVVALGTAAGIGSTYLAVWWLAAACLTALAAAFVPRATTAVAFLALLFPLALTVQLSRLLVEVFIPISGRMLSAIPFDPIIAVLAALPVVLAAPQAAVWLQGVGGKRLATSAALGFALVSLVISLGQFPYSRSKPQRVELRHVEGDAKSWMEFEMQDDPGSRSPHRDLFGGLRPERIGASTFSLPAARRGVVLPIQSAVVPEGSDRKLLLDIGPGGWHEAVLDLPEGRVHGWTVWTERGSFEGNERRIRLVNLPATVAVTIRGAEPAVANLEVRYPTKTPELVETIRRMPEWTAPDGTVVVRRRIGM